MATNTEHKEVHSSDVQRLAEKIKGIRVAMMTTVDTDGYIRSRPMATQEAEFDGTLWFFTKEHTGKVASIENDQHINVTYADDKKNLWISVTGRASLVRDKEKIRELWKPTLKAWFPDGVDDPELALIRVDVEGAQMWDSPSGKLVTLAGFAKSILRGRSIEENLTTEKFDLRH